MANLDAQIAHLNCNDFRTKHRETHAHDLNSQNGSKILTTLPVNQLRSRVDITGTISTTRIARDFKLLAVWSWKVATISASKASDMDPRLR